nr:hypothetical protein [Tanacetum cinerariifolium]
MAVGYATQILGQGLTVNRTRGSISINRTVEDTSSSPRHRGTHRLQHLMIQSMKTLIYMRSKRQFVKRENTTSGLSSKLR